MTQNKVQTSAAPLSGPSLVERHWKLALTAVAAVALILRLIYLWQLQQMPMSGWLIGDARAYDAWGQRIAAGDWIGSEVFYQAPLYPYFLGSIYAVMGHDLLTVRLLQILLAVVGCVLLAMTGRRLFGASAGLIAGLMLACYPPAIFFDGMIQKSALDLPLLTASLYLLVMGRQTSRHRWWIASGAVLGLLMLCRENALVFIGVAGLWALWPARNGNDGTSRSQRRGFKASGALLLGLVITLSPVVIRNAAVGGEVHLTTSQFGPNFYIGNNPSADGTYQPLRFGRGDALYERQDAIELAQQRTGRAMTPGEVSAYWAGQSFRFIREQPAAWLKLIGRKALMTTNVVELADTEDLYGWSDFASILRLHHLWNFGLLLPLAIAGVVLTAGRWREHWLIPVSAGVYVASVILFFVFARYRLPVVPLLMLLAAGGVVMIPALWREKQLRTLILAGLLLVAGGVLSHWPVVKVEHQRAITYLTFASGATQLQPADVQRADAFYRKAIELGPRHAAAYYSYAMLLRDQGQEEQARSLLMQAVGLKSDFADAWNQLGLLMEKQGDAAAAMRCYQQAIFAVPGHASAHNNIGVLYSRAGQLEQALHHYDLALQADPKMAQAYNNRGTVLARMGRLAEAAEAFRQALAINPNYPDAQANLQRAMKMLEAQK